MDEFSFKKASPIVVLTILIIATSLILTGFIFGPKAKNIIVSINGSITEIESKAKTIDELFNEESLYIAEGSVLNVSLEDEIQEDMIIRINTPKRYSIQIGNNIGMEVESLYTRVRDVLKEANITLGEKDYVFPGVNERLISGDTIYVNTIREVEKVITKEIPFEDVVRNSDKLEKGKTKVVQEGENGKLQEFYTLVMENGVLQEEIFVKSELVVEPKPKITERGTKPKPPAPSRGGSLGNISYSNVLTMQATAYHAGYESTGKRPGDKNYGITATGTRARVGVVAVDPRVIPLGTRLYIESMDGKISYGFFTAEDVGGGIKGNRIDIFYETYAEAMRFGRRNLRIYILR